MKIGRYEDRKISTDKPFHYNDHVTAPAVVTSSELTEPATRWPLQFEILLISLKRSSWKTLTTNF